MEVRKGQMGCLWEPVGLGGQRVAEDAVALGESQDLLERGPWLWTMGGRGCLQASFSFSILSVSVSFLYFSFSISVSHHLTLSVSDSLLGSLTVSPGLSLSLFLTLFMPWSSL